MQTLDQQSAKPAETEKKKPKTWLIILIVLAVLMIIAICFVIVGIPFILTLIGPSVENVFETILSATP